MTAASPRQATRVAVAATDGHPRPMEGSVTTAAPLLAGDQLTIATTGDPADRQVLAAGEVDLCTAVRLAAAVDAALAAGTGELLLDLTAVTFFGAAGVRAVAGAARRAEASGVRLRVRTSAAAARWPLQAGGLGPLLDGHRSPAGAEA
jgi:anti-anti-sigma factor